MLGQLVRWSTKRSETYVQSIAVDLSRETQDRIGQVFGILASEADQRAGDALVATIEDALVRGINEGLMQEDAASDRIFETAVARVNGALTKLIEDRNLPVDPGATRSVLVLQKGADVVIATWGDPHVLLFHVSERRPSGRVYDLLSDSRNEGTPETRRAGARRCYANIITGVVGERDRLLLATHDLSQWIPQEELKRVVLDGSPDHASATLQETLLEAAPKLAVALLLVDAEHPDAAPAQGHYTHPTAPQHSLDTLHHTADRTSTIMSPPVMGSILRSIGNAAKRGMRKAQNAIGAIREDEVAPTAEDDGAAMADEIAEVAQELVDERETVSASSSLLEDFMVTTHHDHAAHGGAPKVQVREPAPAPAPAPALTPSQQSTAPATDRKGPLAAVARFTENAVDDVIHNFNSLAKKRRLLLLASLALVLVLNHSVAFADWGRRSAAADATHGKLIASIEQKIDSAESSIIYRDEARARALLEEAAALVATLPERPESAAEEKNRLAERIAEKHNALRHAVALPAAQIVASIAGANGPADLRRMVLRQQVVWSVGKDGSVFKTDLKDGATSSAGSVEGTPSILIPGSNGLIGGGAQGLTRFNYSSAGTAKLTLDLGGNEVTVTDADVYGSRLYVLDAPHNRILRHDAGGTGYGAPVFYLKDGTDLSNGVSMAIDGSVYVAMKDGSVARFLSGKREDFAVQKVDPAIASPVKLRSVEGSDKLYLLDASSPGRLIIFSKKSGALMGQYVSEELAGATDFAIDEPSKVLYAVRGDAVLKFTIPDGN
jgi:hypothetical protein